MKKIFDVLYHHGKTRSPALAGVIRHAHKHHRKYLWGAAGFFGLFKLFSFLIISVFTYTLTNAQIETRMTIAIPATIIEIQDSEDMVQFDLSNVEIGNYQNIQDISLHMMVSTDQPSIDFDTIWSDTPTTLGQAEADQLHGLRFRKTKENLRTLETGYIPSIIHQLQQGNTILYLLPHEQITIPHTTIVMEIEMVFFDDTQKSSDEYMLTPEFENNNSIESSGANLVSEQLDSEQPDNQISETITSEISGDNGGITGTINTGANDTETGKNKTACNQYDKKKDCETHPECQRDKKEKYCTSEITTYITESYNVDITDPTQIPTPSDIQITSKKNKQKIYGYLKIHKNTKLNADGGETMIDLQAPTLITDNTLKGTNDKQNIPSHFTHIQTVQVGDPNNHIIAEEGQLFEISIEITETYTFPGTILHIFTSQDGEYREDLGTTCTVDNDYMCTFQTPHLTLFAVGTITRNNMEFLTQRFRNNNPTSGQILDALFGSKFFTGGNPSAYTTHRTDQGTGCRNSIPLTGILTFTPGGAQTLSANRIYIINSGEYIQTGSISFGGNCIALIGKGKVKINKGAAINLLSSSAKTGIIIDNIDINGGGYSNALIYISTTKNSTINNTTLYNNGYVALYALAGNQYLLINNSQIFHNNNIGLYTNGTSPRNSYITINNTQTFNGARAGMAIYNCDYCTINNSQSYNNASYGIRILYNTGSVINNTIIYNNGSRGLALENSPNIQLNTIKSFKNSTSNNNIYINGASGQYYGNNTIYGIGGIPGFSANSDGTLGWSIGTLSTGDIGYTCDVITNPVNALGVQLQTGATCNTIGRVTSRSYTGPIKYLYGNNMLSGTFIPRQLQPVIRINGPTLTLSSIPYHGHRFIGEYDNYLTYNNTNDLNPPVILFTGETPALGYNIINSQSFIVRGYIYEPNITNITRYENTNGTIQYFPVYDSGLVFMTNFDNVKSIGESTGFIKDLSLTNTYGFSSGGIQRKKHGIFRSNPLIATILKDGGYYQFNGTNSYIEITTEQALNTLNDVTISVWIQAPTTIPATMCILDKYSYTNPGTGFLLYVGTDGKIGFDGRLSNGSTYYSLKSTSTVNDNQRHHITAVKNGTTRSLYIDGQYNTGRTMGAGSFSTPHLLNIGRIRGANGSFFSGNIDEIGIRNRALTSSEIYKLYTSALIAKSDHREYVVYYTGVSSWPYGMFTYGFMSTGVKDINTNTTLSTGYVIKYANICGSGFTINRNNDNFLTSSFRNQNPTSCDIIYALFGTGTNGSDSTAYTAQRSGRNGQCNYQNMQVVSITGGLDKLPTQIENTIYVLVSGAYIQSNYIRLGNCSAIIGSTSEVNLYTKIYISTNITTIAQDNTIIDNITINGTDDGAGDTHQANTKCLSYEGDGLGKNYIINNSNIIKCGETAGISIRDSEGPIIINNTNIYANVNKGISINNTLVSSKNIITNTRIFNNAGYGIYLSNKSDTIISGVNIFKNNQGIYFRNTSRSIVTDSQIYSNTGAGIYFYETNNHLTFNNLHIFNNEYGVQTDSSFTPKAYITINNSQIYNNANDGLLLYTTNYFTINNTHIYNNSGNGLYFAGNNNNSGILNNVFVYNNGLRGIYSEGGNHKYYGLLSIFDNNLGNIYIPGGYLLAGNSSTYSYLGRTGGTTTGGCMSCSRISNPRNIGYSFLIDTTTHPKCNYKGKNTSRTGEANLSYRYGINLTGQKLPVFWSGTTLTGTSIGYSGTQYVAEVNKITPDYTNTQCSCLTHTYRRNNDYFITGGFWNNNPTYCDIIGALLGTGTSGTDRTAYTDYRSGTTEACNTENMEVIYVAPGTGSIPNQLPEKTIYVLTSGSYIQTGTIYMNSCTAIIGSTGTTTLYSTGFLGNWKGMIEILSTVNTIIDNLKINGGQTAYGIPHTRNHHGIRYDGLYQNSTVNNVESFNHQYGNIYADYTNNSLDTFLTLRNITGYNSINHGISIFHARNNRLIGITTFNNTGNGILINLGAENTTLFAIKSYNNTENGIQISETTGVNLRRIETFNNTANGINMSNVIHGTGELIKTYNNTNYGIYLNNVGYTTINNTQSYNNKIGIQVENTSRYNTITNTQGYNNEQIGLAITSGSHHNTIYNTQRYNNKIYGGIGFNGINALVYDNLFINTQSYNNKAGIMTINTTNNTYYNTLTLFNNEGLGNYCRTTNGTSCVATGLDDTGIREKGTGTYYSSFGRTTGTLITGINLTRDYFTNPLNTQGNYLLNRSGARAELTGKQTQYTTDTQTYSYGSEILTQLQPVRYNSGTNQLELRGTPGLQRYTGKYIGSSILKYTGTLLGLPSSRTNSTGIYTVTGIANTPITKYSLFGDIFTFKVGIPINTNTGIYLTTTNGTKRVVTQLSGATYFATHFETTTYLDTLPPTFTFANNSGAECIAGILTITGVVDSGVGLHATPYSFDGSTRSTTNTLSIPAQQPGTQIRTGRVRDALNNSGYQVATYTFYNIPPTANNFTGSTNVGASSVTANRKTGSNATEGACGNTDIVYSGIITQGTKGICTVNGDLITYTPNANQTGTDSCTIQIKDNENSTTTIIIYRENIDTTEIDCLSGRDNDNFINDTFRSMNPTSENIICALYGTGPGDITAYTQFRSGWDTTQCSGVQINVVYTGSLPSSFTTTTNTIYVLASGTYYRPGTITMNSCTALISSGGAYIIRQVGNTSELIQSSGAQNIIIDTINIDGYNKSYNNIYFQNTINSTINTIQSYKGYEGIRYLSNTQSTHNVIYNSKIYNNNIYGIYYFNIPQQSGTVSRIENNSINNCHIYNNGYPGIGYQNNTAAEGVTNVTGYIRNNTVNNSLIYNNGGRSAISYRNDSSGTNNAGYVENNIISNTIVINQGGIAGGIQYNNTINTSSSATGWMSGNIINNSIIMNNRGYQLSLYTQGTFSPTKYYGTNIITGGSSITNNPSLLVTGGANDFPGLGWTTGTIISSIPLSRDYMVNPISTTNQYLLNRSDTLLTQTGQQLQRSGYEARAYSYGSGILTQIQPVFYSGSQLIGGGIYTPSHYIGSSLPKITGDLIGVPPGYATTTSLTVTGIYAGAYPGIVNKYAIFGNIVTEIVGQTINTATGITLVTGLSTNTIITQLYSTTANYFATHFQKTTALENDGPSQVILISPPNSGFITTGTVELVREPAIDTGVGMGSYIYQVSTGASFTTLITSGTTTDTGVIVSGLSIGTTYYRRVLAIDQLGNTGIRSEIWNFTVELPITCLTGRDNDNFINDSFRAMNPTPEHIICALYGSGGNDQTAYTKYRSGYEQSSCLNQGVNVVYIQPGTSTLPLSIGPNTIYVLSSGAYIQTGSITINKCTAIIGSTGTSTLYSTTGLTDSYYGNMIHSFNPASQYTILSTIIFDGIGNGTNGSHEPNMRAVRYNNNNNTIHNIQTRGSSLSSIMIIKNYNGIINNNLTSGGIHIAGNYNHLQENHIHKINGHGIYILGGEYNILTNNTINNSQGGAGVHVYSNSNHTIISGGKIYNNDYGIRIYQSQDIQIQNIDIYNNQLYGIHVGGFSEKIYINNSQIYNNGDKGINGEYTHNITINNTQVYNNNYGIFVYDSTGNILNTVQTYNNKNQGIYIEQGENILNNIKTYNNGGHGLQINGTNNIYYGTINCFTSPCIIINGIAGTGITTLGWTTGELITTGILSRDMITNPISENNIPLLSRSGQYITGQIASYVGEKTTKYSYGSGILTQTQPVIQSGSELIPRGDFDPTMYIGSQTTKKVTGDAMILSTTITGIASDPLIYKFNILGDLITFKTGIDINTSTDVEYITGLNSNRIVIQLRGSNYFATHFQKDYQITPPIISITGTTPTIGQTITNNNFRPQMQIEQAPSLELFTYTFNGIPYSYYDSGLVIMYNFNKVIALGETATSSNIFDASSKATHGSGYGGITRTGNGRRNGGYYFDGNNDYILSKSGIALGNTFTISARVKATQTGAYLRIAETKYDEGFALSLDAGGNAYQWTVNSPTAEGITGGSVIPNERQYIVATYDGTKGYLYVNGILVNSGTFTAPGTTFHPLYIGRYYASASYHRAGYIDEVRVRNRALSSQEIIQMRRSNFAKIHTGTWLFTDDRQCMTNGTYTYTGYVQTTFGLSDTTGRSTVVDIVGYTPYAPEHFHIGSTGVSSSQITLNGQFTGYFKIEDRLGTSGWYTTIQLPLVMSGITYTTNKIINNGENIKIMATGNINILSGSNTGNLVSINSELFSYTGSSLPRRYIERTDYRGYSCPAGIYGNKPYISVDIPPFQNPDIYSGLIFIDFNIP